MSRFNYASTISLQTEIFILPIIVSLIDIQVVILLFSFKREPLLRRVASYDTNSYFILSQEAVSCNGLARFLLLSYIPSHIALS